MVDATPLEAETFSTSERDALRRVLTAPPPRQHDRAEALVTEPRSSGFEIMAMQ